MFQYSVSATGCQPCPLGATFQYSPNKAALDPSCPAFQNASQKCQDVAVDQNAGSRAPPSGTAAGLWGAPTDLFSRGAAFCQPGSFLKQYPGRAMVNILRELPQVVLIEEDTSFKKQTTYTPTYIGLADGAWEIDGGQEHAGEGIVIGVVDTGVDPKHPSFKDDNYASPSRYKGICQSGDQFPEGSCNKKLVGAQYFAEGAIAAGLFNASIHYASPIDAEGHGTHTSSTASGNNGVEVVVDGMSFGYASGMAPKAHVAMYRALYPGFGGLLSDVVAAIEQAVKDKVDILSLSIGPGGPPSGASVFINIFDVALLSATKAGVFVAQAAGNSGPYPISMGSFSPWICSVASSMHDRTYTNSITLGNNKTIEGQGLA
ncbi:hypothetical protein GOP47_0027500, partial [Adiantum capillus-veneris]